jgi:hypothetical protein
MTSALSADVTSVCNPHGELFAFVLQVARHTPLGMWIASGGFAVQTGEWYFVALANSHILNSLVLEPLLGLLLPLTASSPAHPQCDNRDYVGPAPEIVMLYQYVVQTLLHTLLWQLPLTWRRIGWRAVLLLGLPALLYYSGNYSIEQLLLGAAIGTALALICMYGIVCWLLPHLGALNSSRFCTRTLGMYASDDIRHVYVTASTWAEHAGRLLLLN